MSQSRNPSGGNRRNRGHHHHYNKPKINVGDKGKEIIDKIDENNPVIKQFRGYAAELDAKHDRYERIVKFSRDITIESKRIIFLLHTIDKESKRESVVKEATARLNNLVKSQFNSIALELNHQDIYQYLRAYTAGLQEYVEAITFCYYLDKTGLPNWTEIQQNLSIKVSTTEDTVDPSNSVSLITPNEYILGIADLTGELMRKCINNLATGDLESCYETCNLVKNMYKGFLGCVGISGKEIRRKLYTLRQSLIKMENVCYTIKVRGSEIPKHMLADVVNEAAADYPADDDEGYHPY